MSANTAVIIGKTTAIVKLVSSKSTCSCISTATTGTVVAEAATTTGCRGAFTTNDVVCKCCDRFTFKSSLYAACRRVVKIILKAVKYRVIGIESQGTAKSFSVHIQLS